MMANIQSLCALMHVNRWIGIKSRISIGITVDYVILDYLGNTMYIELETWIILLD